MRLKVGVSRKEATDRDGSVGATCEVEVEIAGGASDDEVLRIRDHWLELCEATVDEEIDRLRDGASRPNVQPAPAARPKTAPAPAPVERREFRDSAPTESRRDQRADRVGAIEDERPPIDGRQLLGWAAKQDPDAKGLVIGFGKKRGYPTKIVDWDDEQVRAAYRFARGRQGR